jgi:hypothetical protein
MKVVPTLEGGLSIRPESERDWQVLEMIPADMGRSGHLAESLGGLMDEESEWDEWVVPDLVENFDKQCSYVALAIKRAHSEVPSPIIVSPQDVDHWYGALNQARLSLQARYRLDAIEFENVVDDLPDEIVQAYFRDRFYASLQSLFLEFVMDAGDS